MYFSTVNYEAQCKDIGNKSISYAFNLRSPLWEVANLKNMVDNSIIIYYYAGTLDQNYARRHSAGLEVWTEVPQVRAWEAVHHFCAWQVLS